MELRHLRYFSAVAEHASVSAAAGSLHVTQPGLSRQLRQLETELGLQLFERRRGRLVISSAGRALLPVAREVLALADDLQVAAGALADGRVASITIGAPTVTLTDVVAPFIATLGDDDPTADVMAADGMSTVEVLDAGADLAIGTTSTAAPYRSLPLAVLPIWAYVPADHRWAQRAGVGLAELVSETVIRLPPAYTAREALDAALAGAGLAPVSVLEASNGTVAQALAAAGRGVAVVSDDPRFDLVPVGVDVPGAGARLSIRLVASWSSGRSVAPVVATIADRLGEFVRARYGVDAG